MNEVVLKIPTGYERITDVNEMSDCTHVLLMNGELADVQNFTSMHDGRQFISFTVGGADIEPYFREAVDAFICLRKRKPKRVELEVEISDAGNIQYRHGSLTSELAPFVNSKVKITVEEVIE